MLKIKKLSFILLLKITISYKETYFYKQNMATWVGSKTDVLELDFRIMILNKRFKSIYTFWYFS